MDVLPSTRRQRSTSAASGTLTWKGRISIDLKRDSAVSTILVAVAGLPMSPSTRATWLEAPTSVDWVIFRALATTLKSRSTNPFAIPAPIPCDAPVTMAVFRGPFMVVYLKK